MFWCVGVLCVCMYFVCGMCSNEDDCCCDVCGVLIGDRVWNC